MSDLRTAFFFRLECELEKVYIIRIQLNFFYFFFIMVESIHNNIIDNKKILFTITVILKIGRLIYNNSVINNN